ncbi:MAG TPA: class II glutamine amidotransferase, partial [Elusimicrobiota bacterium]|nr:class II glutamine amidotransferase [Elusimicrobiota bacterium]
MCRFFGVLSTSSVEAAEPLVGAPQSLLWQSDADPKRRQSDGWGVGWFVGPRAQIAKSPKPMYRQRRRLLRIANAVRSLAVVGHVRWASNPLKLSKQALLGTAHTQPFQYRDWIFAHNGTLYIPREVTAHLGPAWAKRIRGKNDSEVLFYWLMRYLNPALSGNSPRVAEAGRRVRQAIRGIDTIWSGCRNRYPLHKFPYHGLNWILTNGRLLLAFCYADPRGYGASKALADRRQPYYQLQRQVTKDRLTIASEPLDPAKTWEPFRHGELLVAVRNKRILRTRS